jgi:hypothetical protein
MISEKRNLYTIFLSSLATALFICELIFVPQVTGTIVPTQPQITGISGTLTHGSLVTITGSGFGTKTQAAPWRWDPIEGVNAYSGLTPGSPAPAGSGGYWEKNFGPLKYGTNNQRGKSTANLYTDSGTNCPANEDNKKLGVMLPSSNTRYVSFWIWHNVTLTDQNAKLIRWWVASGDASNQITIQDSWATNGAFWIIRRDDNNTTTCYDSGYSSPLIDWPRPIGGEWERVELYIKNESNMPTNNDGVIQLKWTANGHIYTHTVDPANFNCYVTSIGYQPLNYFTFGFDKNCTGIQIPVEIRLDDIYIDNTRARVELGDAPTWDGCTHREIQIPSSWSDSSISVALNQGSFGNFGITYLYVVDKDGNVNQNGFPLSPSSEKPQAPVLH